MTEKEKRAKGYLYDANYDKELLAEIADCWDLCNELNSTSHRDTEKRTELLGKLLGKAGKEINVVSPFYCDYGYNVYTGDYFFANRNCQFLDGSPIRFGDHVFIAPNCVFTTAEHAIDAEQRNAGMEVSLPITVGNNVWFGTGVVVLGGVTIGDNTVIGAGSVVTKDIPANVVAFGNPCKVYRAITQEDKKKYPTAE